MPKTTQIPSNPSQQASQPVTETTSKPSPEEDKREVGTEQVVGKGELTLEEALKLFDDAKKYVDTGPRISWDKYFRVYEGERVDRNYDGISEPVNREAHTIIETLVSNIAGGNPTFHFVKTNEEQSDDTEILNGMLDYYMICNEMGLKNQEWVREMLLYGTSILGVEWRKGKPWIENIALRDFFVDPTSTGLVKTRNPAEYAGLQYLIRKETAKRERIYDAEKDEMVARYTGLDDLTPANSSGNIGKDTGDNSSMDKAFKDLFNGSTLGDEATKDQIHVIKLHHIPTGRIYEIGNRKKFIYNKPTWCQRREITEEVQVEVEGQIINTTRKLDEIEPFLPFAVLRDYIDSSQFYGRGEMAVIMSDAELLNDYESMDVDNNAYQNTPMYWIDPQFADLAPEIETIPGAVYPIPQNAMGALERPQLSGDLDNKKDRIAERMRRATAADEAVQGVGQQKGRVTATEVSTQLAQAQNRFSTKLSNLESEGYAQLGSVIFKLVQIFVTNETAVRIVGKKGVHFKDYDPWEFNGEWEAHVKLDTTIKREQMEVGQKQNQMFLALDAQAGIFDPIELARYKVQTINSEFTDEQFNAMLAKAAPPKPSDTEIKAQIDIQKSELSAIAGIYDNAGPNIKVQIEEKLGLEPDVQHEGDAHNRMLEQANAGADFVNPTTDASNGTLPGMDAILNPEPTPPPSGTKKPA